jgi:hypothetical protein
MLLDTIHLSFAIFRPHTGASATRAANPPLTPIRLRVA